MAAQGKKQAYKDNTWFTVMTYQSIKKAKSQVHSVSNHYIGLML